MKHNKILHLILFFFSLPGLKVFDLSTNHRRVSYLFAHVFF